MKNLNPAVQPYLHALTHLKRASTRYGTAPHKPVLVLTLMELMAKGAVIDNRFEANAESLGTFLENWQLLVTTSHQADFTQPFYYLQSDKAKGEPFWYLQPKPGCQINAPIKSVNTLAEVLDYGMLRTELFVLLQNPVSRTTLQIALLDAYFAERKAYFLAAKHSGEGYLHDVEPMFFRNPKRSIKPSVLIPKKKSSCVVGYSSGISSRPINIPAHLPVCIWYPCRGTALWMPAILCRSA